MTVFCSKFAAYFFFIASHEKKKKCEGEASGEKKVLSPFFFFQFDYSSCVTTCLQWRTKKKREIIGLLSTSLLSSTFPFVLYLHGRSEEHTSELQSLV